MQVPPFTHGLLRQEGGMSDAGFKSPTSAADARPFSGVIFLRVVFRTFVGVFGCGVGGRGGGFTVVVVVVLITSRIGGSTGKMKWELKYTPFFISNSVA